MILPYQDLPLVNSVPNQTPDEVLDSIKEWAVEGVLVYSFAFLQCDGDPHKYDSYKLPIGRVCEGCLATSLQIIKELAVEVATLPKPDNATGREILTLYFEKAEAIPPWGVREFYDLQKQGKWVVTLRGPDKAADLRPHQKRYVILVGERTIYGPIFSKG